MTSWLIVEYLARGDAGRWQAVSHLGSHGLPAAPVRYGDEAAAGSIIGDLAAVGLEARLVRTWPNGDREIVRRIGTPA